MSVEYEKKEFHEDLPEFFSDRGERMRSKSEVLIANLLHRHRVPYRYEYPLLLRDLTVHPDFLILHIRERREILWEHFGLMDDHYYRENALRKIDKYEQCGFWPGRQIIYTFETAKQPLDTKKIERKIQQFLL